MRPQSADESLNLTLPANHLVKFDGANANRASTASLYQHGPVVATDTWELLQR
jgi:hypothetical protein